MAGWGLLQGLGRGISQGADMMQRAMSEDREAERQRMREATAERWRQVQSAKEDKRYADSQKNNAEQVQYQKERDKVGDARHAEQMGMAKQELNIRISERRKAEIEGNIQAVQREWDKASDSIERRHERLIDQAKAKDLEANGIKDKDGLTETDKAYKARDKALEDLSERMNGKLMPIIKSYGSELKGTAYGSLYDDILAEKSAAKDQAGQQFLKDAGVTDAAGDFAASATKAGGGRAGVVDGITAGGATTNPDQQTQRPTGLLQPGFVNGFISSAHGNINPRPIDESSLTPAQLVTTKAGQGLGYFPGRMVDTFQQVGEHAVQPAWDYLNTPINHSKTPPILPGEGLIQYQRRTGIKQP